VNCTIERNTSVGSGGGIVGDSYARIENCIVSFNRSENDGGGLMCNPYVSIIGCTINNNQAKIGGGLKTFEFCLVQNCIITGNTANRSAGIQALYAWIRNCLVSYNEATIDAGGVYLQGGGFLQNCTVVKNKSLETVGGILCDNDSHVRNCIIFNNNGLTQNNYKNNGEDVEYYNNCTRPQIATGYNISDDPRFKDPGSSDFHLTSGSPCINKGKSDAWMLLAHDLDGTKRIIGNIPDIGAYEYPVSLSVTIDADKTEGTEPLTVSFSSRVSGEEPETLWYLWDIDGDGRCDSHGQDYQNVLHTYTNPGIYSISLSLSNAWGVVASVTRTNMVDVLPEPLLTPIILVYIIVLHKRR
jgi:PKD repeat protein